MSFLCPSQQNVSKTDSSSAVQKFRRMLADENDIIAAPGVYDGLTARIALAAGHKCLYMTGAGTSLSRLGLPDLGFLSLNDMYTNAAMIASLDRSVPIIADADTGFGGPLQVGRTVSMYMAAGIAALHIEDQVQTKRCGHLAGKEVVPTQDFLARINAAVQARNMENGDIVIIARTDALQQLGYDDAVARLRASIRLGADIAFLEGIETIEQAERVTADLAPTPVLYNMVAGGVSPSVSSSEAQKLGFRVIIFPSAALGPVTHAVTESMSKLKTNGQEEMPKGKDVLSPRTVFDICGLQDCFDFDQRVVKTISMNGDSN